MGYFYNVQIIMIGVFMKNLAIDNMHTTSMLAVY